MLKPVNSSWKKKVKLPDAVLACVGGGSNAMGAFYNFIDDKDVKLIGCEAGGKGVDTPYNAAALTNGQIGDISWDEDLDLIRESMDRYLKFILFQQVLIIRVVGPEHAHLEEILEEQKMWPSGYTMQKQ